MSAIVAFVQRIDQLERLVGLSETSHTVDTLRNRQITALFHQLAILPKSEAELDNLAALGDRIDRLPSTNEEGLVQDGLIDEDEIEESATEENVFELLMDP